MNRKEKKRLLDILSQMAIREKKLVTEALEKHNMMNYLSWTAVPIKPD